MKRLNKLVMVVVLNLVLTIGLLAGCTTSTPPALPPTSSPISLPESPPAVPPSIVGSAVLEPYGTTILKDGFGANRAFSEYFLFQRPIAQDRFQEEVFVYIVVSSDIPNRFNVREPGYIFFELEPEPGQGLWEFSPQKLICENALTLKNGTPISTTKVVGKLRTRGDYFHFRLSFANFDPRSKPTVSWEIYTWR